MPKWKLRNKCKRS